MLTMRFKASFLLVVVALCLLFINRGTTQTTDVQGRVAIEALMQRKLESSQALIKGLALDDYKLIEREAQQLQLLSLDASWNVVQTKQYARFSDEFREAAQKIRKAGKEKNLDAAGLGYFQLTMTCIDCHRHVRQARGAR